MAEKIRPLHLPPTSTPSQQSLLVPTSSPDSGAQHGMSVPKPQQVPGHHPQAQGSGQPDIALHTRPTSSSGPGTSAERRLHGSWTLVSVVSDPVRVASLVKNPQF